MVPPALRSYGEDGSPATGRQGLAVRAGLARHGVRCGHGPQAPDRTGYAVGLSQQHPVGSACAYNNAQQRLFGPLEMTHTRMTRDASRRSTQVFFGLQTTCPDLARFGELFLHRGRVDGKRILPRAYVRASVGRSSTQHNAAYGYLWWLNRSGPVAPGASSAMFAALGLGGQVLMVDPGTGS